MGVPSEGYETGRGGGSRGLDVLHLPRYEMFEIHVDKTGQMIGSFLDYMVIYMVMLMVILVMLNMTLLAVMTVLMVFSATLGFKLTYEEIFTTFGVSASKFNYRGSSLEN